MEVRKLGLDAIEDSLEESTKNQYKIWDHSPPGRVVDLSPHPWLRPQSRDLRTRKEFHL